MIGHSGADAVKIGGEQSRICHYSGGSAIPVASGCTVFEEHVDRSCGTQRRQVAIQDCGVNGD